jgi:hypothetical protein
MNTWDVFRAGAAVLVTALGLTVSGCVKSVPKPVPQPPQEAPKDPLLTKLLGVWELPGKTSSAANIVFEKDERLVFKGALEFYNPAQWRLDSAAKELHITLPQTPNEKLDIFKMYVGDGVKAFSRPNKQITYHFGPETTGLNFAGWVYSKPAPNVPAAAPEAEPVLK